MELAHRGIGHPLELCRVVSVSRSIANQGYRSSACAPSPSNPKTILVKAVLNLALSFTNLSNLSYCHLQHEPYLPLCSPSTFFLHPLLYCTEHPPSSALQGHQFFIYEASTCLHFQLKIVQQCTQTPVALVVPQLPHTFALKDSFRDDGR